MNCYCCSLKQYASCCEPYIFGHLKPETAENLMRSRFSAYTISNIDYLINTTHFSTVKFHDGLEMLNFANQNKWTKLEIINFSETQVEFKAHYIDKNLKPQIHHEKSTFKKENDGWFYVDGKWY